MQIKFNPALLQTQNLLNMWQSINGFFIKGHQRV